MYTQLKPTSPTVTLLPCWNFFSGHQFLFSSPNANNLGFPRKMQDEQAGTALAVDSTSIH
jgi:hypothetical protein